MISVVVLAKDEEKNIETCLKTLQWCDEIIVVDDYSEDKTREIAKKFKVNVFKRHLKGNFASQRNFGLEKAKGEWVLFVDSDEKISNLLASEIQNKIKKTDFNGFYLKRRDSFGGKELKHGETGRMRLIRLGRKKAGKWKRKVHETWRIKGKVGELYNPLIHLPHQTISKFLKEINFYSTLHAEALIKEGVKPSLFRIIVNPSGKFIQNYFLRLGFLDGTPGFIMAIMMTFHSFLARSKLYILGKK